MKQLIIIAAIVFSTSVIFAQKTANEYVTTKEGTVFYENLNFGVFCFLNGIRNGEKTTYEKADVLEYKKDDQVYTRLPEIVNNEYTGETVFMKAISYRCGLILYEYSSYDVNGNICTDLYVFNKDKLIVDVNQKNYLTLFSFFSGELFTNTANAF
ncbi:MAG: hypothetical protein JXL97_08915 [Bacteroidales bacterium]|nr:hypothetical protein [Bacteroidales bacterium]